MKKKDPITRSGRKYKLSLKDFKEHVCTPLSKQKGYINKKVSISDLTNGLGAERNYICHRCNAHLWKGRVYTGAEWENYVNSV